MKSCRNKLFFLFITGVMLISANVATAEEKPEKPEDDPALSSTAESDPAPDKPWYKKIDSEWGGHIKFRSGASLLDDDSIFQPVGTSPCFGGYAEFRLKNRLMFGNWGEFETHYEVVLSGGGLRRKANELSRRYPELAPFAEFLVRPLEDNGRLMDLTRVINEGDSYILVHRLDRLCLTLLPEWGVVRVGRQAVTWGNGMLFNPMDLLNPFSPTDIERDYKIGDDMVSARFPTKIGELQFLYVPRRNQITGEVSRHQSSLAGKWHFASGATEFDIMAARHYRDTVMGVGSAGYLGDAAWRLDATWTFLDDTTRKNGFFSLVANMDYSWVWKQKNVYGFLEFYFNGLCDSHYDHVYTDPNIINRIQRGELFTMGRVYLGGHIRVELHPLFNVYMTSITNLEDLSGVLQPRAVWDVAQNVQITFGGNIAYGARGSEFGGVEIPHSSLINKAPNNVFVWLTRYF